MFPQYSSAATGSAIEEALKQISKLNNQPNLRVIRDFYDHPNFIESMAKLIEPHIESHDHVLFSYHGLPERQILKGGCAKVCETACPIPKKGASPCYRAQCYATSNALANHLNLNDGKHTTTFQSRLGKTPWIQPYTDETLTKLAQQGIKKLLIACPSFTADCLETIEEIGMQGQEQWHELGGETLTLVPCVNSDKDWIESVKNIVIGH